MQQSHTQHKGTVTRGSLVNSPAIPGEPGIQSQVNEKPHKATMKIKNADGEQIMYVPTAYDVLFIPVSVGSESYKRGQFHALVTELIARYINQRDVPLLLVIGDSVQWSTLLFKDDKEFTYTHADFATKEALQAKLKGNEKEKGYERIAQEKAIQAGIDWKTIECAESLKLLTDHFRNYQIMHWNEIKNEIAYPIKIKEFTQLMDKRKKVKDDLEFGALKYFTDYGTRLLKSKNNPSSIGVESPIDVKEFIMTQSQQYLKEDLVVLVEAIRHLLDKYKHSKVVLAYPFPHGDPWESATFHLILSLLEDNEKARLTTPCIHLNQKGVHPTKNKKAEKVDQKKQLDKPVMRQIVAPTIVPPVEFDEEEDEIVEEDKEPQDQALEVIASQLRQKLMGKPVEQAMVFCQFLKFTDMLAQTPHPQAAEHRKIIKRKSVNQSPQVTPPVSTNNSPPESAAGSRANSKESSPLSSSPPKEDGKLTIVVPSSSDPALAKTITYGYANPHKARNMIRSASFNTYANNGKQALFGSASRPTDSDTGHVQVESGDLAMGASLAPGKSAS